MSSKAASNIFKCQVCQGEFTTKARYMNHKCESVAVKKPRTKKIINYTCEFCDKPFKQQGRFEAHSCEKKTRYLSRNNVDERLAYLMYEKWYRETIYKDTTMIEFVKSGMYGAFLAFAKFVNEVQPYNWQSFMKWLMEKQTPVDRWVSRDKYVEYLRSFVRNETYDTALERSILFILKKCAEANIEPRDFMDQVGTNSIVLWLETGRISPWVLLLSPKRNVLLGRLSKEQADRVLRFIDVQYWNKKIDLHRQEADIVKVVLRDCEL